MYYNVKLDTYDPLTTAGWRVATIPKITHSEKKRDRFTIPMRDGEVVGSDIWRGNAYITVVFHSRIGQEGWNLNFLGDTMDGRYARLMDWLVGKTYLHISSQDVNNFSAYNECGKYELIGWNITNETRVSRDYIRVEVQFEVVPFKFLETSQIHPPYTSDTTIENSWDESMPTYILGSPSVSGGAFSLTVNGYTMSGTFPTDAANINIDTRRQIAYYEANYRTYEVTNISGDFRKLRLPAHSVSTLSKTGVSVLVTYTKFGVKI